MLPRPRDNRHGAVLPALQQMPRRLVAPGNVVDVDPHHPGIFLPADDDHRKSLVDQLGDLRLRSPRIDDDEPVGTLGA